MTTESSTDYSVIGERSIKITSNNSDYTYINLPNITGENGDSFTGSMKVLNNTGQSISLRLVQNEGGTYTSVTIPSSADFQSVSISNTLTADSGIYLKLITYASGVLYIDSISLIKS